MEVLGLNRGLAVVAGDADADAKNANNSDSVEAPVGSPHASTKLSSTRYSDGSVYVEGKTKMRDAVNDGVRVCLLCDEVDCRFKTTMKSRHQ